MERYQYNNIQDQGGISQKHKRKFWIDFWGLRLDLLEKKARNKHFPLFGQFPEKLSKCTCILED